MGREGLSGQGRNFSSPLTQLIVKDNSVPNGSTMFLERVVVNRTPCMNCVNAQYFLAYSNKIICSQTHQFLMFFFDLLCMFGGNKIKYLSIGNAC